HPKMFEVFADKYEVREYVRNVIGDEYLIPVNMTLDSPEKLSTDILPDTPFIIKTNHDCSGGIIVRDKREVDIDYAKRWCKFNLSNNHFYASRERHYKNLSRRIIIEKLLLTKENKIPNDYKINCINGEPQFIYCAIDREGENYRKIYDVNWSELDFKWGSRDVINNKFNGKNIPVPNNLDEMLKISRQLSRGYKYLRVDLYDVDGKLYVGELTMYHGAGFDIIEPKEIDEYYGSMINVNKE
ncbi:hypothetical protein K2B97_004600, partial [Vibrio parahaemolyticus]|nr:hypothetical protein [Vibrio parahaemolyticus]